MGYEAHIAGVGDTPRGKPFTGAAIRAMQSASAREIARRRAAVVEAVRAVAPVEIVNGGGTGSVAATAAEDAVTEVTAGSGFYAPTLFDHYSTLALRPAAMFTLPVVRKPSATVATALGGGYPASGAAEAGKLPEPYLPHGLKLDGTEGAGEVQTPLLGPGARDSAASATASTCATRRRASCASASTRCWSSRAARWSTSCRPTAARAARSSEERPRPARGACSRSRTRRRGRAARAPPGTVPLRIALLELRG